MPAKPSGRRPWRRPRKTRAQVLAEMTHAAQKRTQFCLDHELEVGVPCPRKNTLEGCLLWEKVKKREL